MTKVLVFESDPSFAGELRTELGRLGCTVQICDDGNVGLQVATADRPDLILLSIELPRMNGFSVCNKLKKDPQLKDVPLVIMSSESSEETFEQHRKLRTRAEDYVHKPIAFGELLQHIRVFVQLEASAPDSGAILVEELEVMEEVSPEDIAPEEAPVPVSAPPASLQPSPPSVPLQPAAPPPPPPTVDSEIDDFVGGAFDNMMVEYEEERTMVKPLSAVGTFRSSQPPSPSAPPPAPSAPPPPAAPSARGPTATARP